MIVAIGHDLIEIGRIEAVWKRNGQRFLDRIYTEEELEYCLSQAQPLPSLAARFAAKEAFQKVWPRVHRWKDVWVTRTPTPTGAFAFDRPKLDFGETIRLTLTTNGWKTHLSLTHTHMHASAVVILEETCG